MYLTINLQYFLVALFQWYCFSVVLFFSMYYLFLHCNNAIITIANCYTMDFNIFHFISFQKSFADHKQMLHDMRTSASTSGNGPARVYAEHLQRADDTVRSAMTDEASVRRNLRKYRGGANPPDPRTLQDLIIPADFQNTSDGRRFLLHDNGSESEELIYLYTRCKKYHCCTSLYDVYMLNKMV